MHIRPLGHRILVRPDAQQDETDSGLILPADRDHVATSGTVVECGPGGSLLRYRARQQGIRDCCEFVESMIHRFSAIAPLLMLRDEMAGLLGTTAPGRDLCVGDRVAFPDDVGHRTNIDGEEYIVLNEDDVAVVVAEESKAVA